MRRSRTLDTILPLAAAEPDGLLLLTDGSYVRLLEARQVLQPLRGGRAHREAIREQLAVVAGRLAVGQSIQVVIEATILDADRVLVPDWASITTASTVAARHNEDLAVAMRRLG